MMVLFDEFVDAFYFSSVLSIGFAIIFVDETVDLVVLSVPLGFVSCSLFSGSNTSVDGGFFILLCLFLLHAIFILFLLSVVFDFQILVDSGNWLTIALVPGSAIVFVDETI